MACRCCASVRRGLATDVARAREQLRARYLSLGVGELVAATTFAVAGAVVVSRGWSDASARSLWCALIPLLVVLIQGGSYWLLARRWVMLAPMPGRLARLFRVLRIVNPVVLAAGLVGVVTWWPASAAEAALVAFVWTFGVIEYVNYFQVRLAYPAARWCTLVRQWRTPQLVKDLRGVGWA